MWCCDLTIAYGRGARARGPDVSRGSRGALRTLRPVRVPAQQGESGPQPMQLGRTSLSQSERDARMREGGCRYCGSSGHLHPPCLELRGKRQRLSGEGEPLTDSTSPTRAQGLFLGTTIAWGMSETRLQAFVDLRATGKFLDAGIANKLALSLVPLDKPLPTAAIDGQSFEPGVVSHQICQVTLQVGPHTEQIALFIIHAPDLKLIFGYHWLPRHNPHVDGLSWSVLSWGLTCQTSCFQLPKPQSGSGHDLGGLDLSRVPQDLGEAFSKQKVQLLPPHQPYDMTINLLPGSSLPRGLFSLSGPELQAMDKYIQEALALGFSGPSTSPAGMGLFFVRKKDSGLQPFIDYRGLKKITI
ncbi:hypothetical protein P4O66_001599 [Electrophorus voltai]|uniref:CCHC-type domain-containing protein n=1 Tax=Electrophorus voltai TaxID=2609070 RepID=A0AAD8Z4G7_9TELE|nr:hypothetical protein P4O66_001599 [Electrophorus voltai]